MEELTGADTRGDGLYAKRLISSCNEESLEHKKLVVASETTEYVPGYFDQNKTVMTRCTTIRSPLEGGFTGRTIERICHVEAITRTNKAVKV